MKVEFYIQEKTFQNKDGENIKYYVLQRKLVDGSMLEVPIKSEKFKLLTMSLIIEQEKK